MDVADAVRILNAHIFDGDKRLLVQKVAEHPERYVGIFRPTKPRAKLIQNLLQSHEIRFGDGMESLIREMLSDAGYEVASGAELQLHDGALSLDQFFCETMEGGRCYFIEQKVRDDHDSTKKRGQISNFEDKLEVLCQRYGSHRLIGIMYFIDDSLHKNQAFYEDELEKMGSTYGVELYLFYGRELFAYLGKPMLWDQMVKWLQQWRQGIPDLPEVNMDLDPQGSFQALRCMKLRYWRKLLDNETLWKEGVVKVLFPKGDTLVKVAEYFQAQGDEGLEPYRRMAVRLRERLEQYYDRATA